MEINKFSCIPIRLYLHWQIEDQIWLMDHYLLTPDVDNFGI